MTLTLLLLGFGAGALSTVAGQGGGLLLVLACASLVGPRDALAITAPALLFGNLHRSVLLRLHIDRPVATRIVAGAVPGALIGGLVAAVIPLWILRGSFVAMTVLALAKAAGLIRFRVPRTAFAPVGLVTGGLTGTSGGAGVLLAPVLFSAGLNGRAFIATASAIAVATHLGRIVGYAETGLFSTRLIVPTLAVSTAIFAGNALGERLRVVLFGEKVSSTRAVEASDRAGEGKGSVGMVQPTEPDRSRLMMVIEYGTLVVCTALSVAGIG